jgi:hypothetical protein
MINPGILLLGAMIVYEIYAIATTSNRVYHASCLVVWCIGAYAVWSYNGGA